jgi:hypothetical protein
MKSLDECREIRLPRRVRCRAIHQHADAPHPLGLLRARRERPRHRCAGKRDKFASFHRITSRQVRRS